MRVFVYLLIIGFCIIRMSTSCTHDASFVEEDLMPIDTMINPVDTMPIDTMLTGVPCEPDVVYFDLEILPILQSNCAFSGCHDANSAEDGVILESYASVIETADVEPFNLNDSEIFEVLIDNDEDERMPPVPTEKLSAEKIQLIATWILQGAKNLTCDPNLEGCNTEAVRFSEFVKPTISTHCEGCHSGAVPSGGIDLTNYNNIKAKASDGSLVGAISWEAGFVNMPQGGNQLPSCTIEKIKAWIADGAQNN